MIGTIFGTIFGVILLAIICVAGVFAIIAAILKGIKRRFGSRDVYTDGKFPKGVKRWRA